MRVIGTALLLAGTAFGLVAMTSAARAEAAAPAKVSGPKIKWDLSTYGNPVHRPIPRPRSHAWSRKRRTAIS